MKELEEMILKKGTILPGDILKVGNFLNQQVDTELLIKMADEIKRLYNGEKITKVLTIEASGIAFATFLGYTFRVPFVFGKKSMTSNVSGEVYKARVHSYTHGNDYDVVVPKEYISKDDKVLIADDFLATGNALNGLIDIVHQAGAEVVGCAIEIEKSYQNGGNDLRKQGIRVESLAKVKSMTDNSLEFEN